MKFCWVTLNVKDMDESVDFYKNVIELKLNRRFKSPTGMELAFLGEGETQIELMYNPSANEENNYGNGMSIGFVVDSVDLMIKKLINIKIPIHSGPFQPNPNIKFFYILDPNGMMIQFVENIIN